MKLTYLIILALLYSHNLSAAERLNDSASPRQRVMVSLDWVERDIATIDPGDKLHAMVTHILGLEIRLDTSAFIGKTARIFLTLPTHIRGINNPNGMRMTWTTQGVFADGSVIPGNRSQIFQGEINDPVLLDIFNITLYINARYFTSGLEFNPIYEIEVQ
ncbi:MAG: hypothetical protein E2O62_04935 [Gammaproteobacteria bacterium]|nr:MAG: hypothetical protein E2O62_04935 [Gammaproteobacteria bacterium]